MTFTTSFMLLDDTISNTKSENRIYDYILTTAIKGIDKLLKLILKLINYLLDKLFIIQKYI